MLKSNLNVPGTWHLRVQVMLTIANYVFNKLFRFDSSSSSKFSHRKIWAS